MKKDSGGFQGFMLNNFEKIALGAFGVLVLVFLVFATVLGSYYDKEASELDDLVAQKVSAVEQSNNPDNFQGLQGVEVTRYDEKLKPHEGEGVPPENSDSIIEPVVPDLAKRPEPEVFPATDLKGFGVREVLALNGTVGGDNRTTGGSGGTGGSPTAGSFGGGGSDAGSSLGVGGEGDENGGNDNSSTGGNNAVPGSTGSAPRPSGYQPPTDSKTIVKSFITLVGTIPNAEQTKEFIAKTRNTLPPGVTHPRYVAFYVERRAKGGSENWEPLDQELIREIIDEVRKQWVSSNVEEVVDERHIFPMYIDQFDSNQQAVPYSGYVLPLPPAIGREWGDRMSSGSSSIITQNSGPVYRPLDDVFGQWQAARTNAVSFLANKEAYESQPDGGGLVAVIDKRQQLSLTVGAEADRLVLTTPDSAPFQEGISFKIIDDGTGTSAVLNPKIGELRRAGDVIVKHPDQAWYELYRKTTDDELQRTVIMFLDGRDMATEAVVFQQNLRDFQSRQGFGGSRNNESQAGDNSNSEPQAPQGPADYLFRFYDTSVESGREYQYRIKLVLENPNFRVNPGYLDETADSELNWLESEWSEPTDWISVTSYADLVVGPARAAKPGTDPKVSVYFREPSTDDTPLKNESAVAMLLTPVDTARGQWMNYVVDNPVPIDVVLNAPAEMDIGDGPAARFKFTHRYRTDELILDIRGGDTYGKLKVPGETLVLDANGNLVVKSELESGYETADAQYALGNKNNSRDTDADDDDDGNAGIGGTLPGGDGDTGGRE